ncbi:MAG: hypothetical protein ACKO96_44370 [Flammeovirgaceae bacterium]
MGRPFDICQNYAVVADAGDGKMDASITIATIAITDIAPLWQKRIATVIT